MKTEYTKARVRADQTYVRHLMRLIDQELKKPVTNESLDSLDELGNEIAAAAASSLHYYVEEQRERLNTKGH